MAESDKQLELKKRARRRLVGAAALALTAAIVLPMVMDHEPKPLTQDIQIRIPSPDSPRNDAPKAAADTTASKPDIRSDSAPAVQADTPAPSRPADEASLPQAPGDKADSVPSTPSPAKVETKPEPKPTAKPDLAEPKPAAKAEREARVEAILAGKEPAASGGSFVVQLGAFSDPANVSKVRARVKEAGFNSYTETVKGAKGEQTRVRAGPFASREAADQAAAKLKHAGLAGVVASR